MDKKLLILVFAAVIVLAVIGLIGREKETRVAEKSILFEDECNSDEECGYSFKMCKSGQEVNCENGCIYGKCTKCVPICPGESECGNASCLDSIRICSDGRKVRCANYCKLDIGECTSCIPDCNISVTDRINYEAKDGKIVLDAIPCISANYTEKITTELVVTNKTEARIPKDYSIIIGPFSLECEGDVGLTLNIPQDYIDVKALRCRGNECNSVKVRQVTELRCGGIRTKEFFRESRYLEPRFMPIKIKERSFNVTSNLEIGSDKYKVRFNGNFKDFNVTLSMPKEAVEGAKNPSLRISGTPLVVNIKGGIREDINATATMPYTSMEGFEEDSIGMYVKAKEGWEYVGGEVNKKDKTLTATITNISRYLNERNEIMLSLMAVFCVSCYDASLNKAYQPEKGSENAVILVHGFDPDPDTFQPLIDEIRLTNQPVEVFTFDYPSSKPMKDNIKELMSILERNHANYKNIDIVSHSVGGLIVQQALYNSYLENMASLEKREPLKYNYLEKVRRVILAGAPNEGSPVVAVYKNLFKSLINKEKDFLFNLNSEVTNQLVNGVITPRVPGIDYRVIAGTRPYEFNLLFFRVSTGEFADIYEKNDGIITVKSAQHVGEGYIDNQCKNYWEVNLTHTELIDDPIARRIIGKIISEDISEEDMAVLGNNKYFDLSIEDCSAEDSYVIIGKKIRKEMVLDESGCNCGNGYCGEGENEINCPSDCTRFLSKGKENRLFIFLILVLVSFFISFQYIIYRRFSHPHLKRVIKYIKTNYDIVPSEGYTDEQIRKAFLSKGWPKRVVDDAIRLLRKEFYHNYHKPLKKHLEKHLRRGYTEEHIKRALINSGWKEGLIEKVLRGEELEPHFRLKESKKKKHKLKPEERGKYFGFKE